MSAPAVAADPVAAVPVTARLARFASGLRAEDVPADVLERAGVLLADWLACAVGGAAAASTEAIADGLRDAGTLDGPYAVPGRAGRVSAHAAAFLAGASAHALDFDDTHSPAELHPGAPVIAAALAAAQVADAGTDELLVAIVAGYEVMTRVAFGLPATPHASRGFHLTATTGVFGAAAAAANVLGLSAARVEDAFGTALSRAAGSGQFLDNGAWTKRTHVGAAAADGLLAALLARAGVSGASAAFEGTRGFFRLHSDHPRPEDAVAGLGERWELMRTGIKPFACCRAIHAPLDGALALRADGLTDPARVAEVRIGLARRCADIVGFPEARKRAPASEVDCQFSLHFCVAAALVTGRLATEDFARLRADPVVRDLMERTHVEIDDDAEAAYPEDFAARVRITDDAGRVHEVFVPRPPGDPERMLTPVELRAKFEPLVRPRLGADLADRLLEAALGAATHPRPVRELLELAAPTPAAVR